MDKANIQELLNFILESIILIKDRFKPITSSDVFLDNNDGLMRLEMLFL